MTWHLVIGGGGENGKKTQSQIQYGLLDLKARHCLELKDDTKPHVRNTWAATIIPKPFSSILIF